MNWKRFNALLVAIKFPKMPKVVSLFSAPNKASA